MHLFIEVEAAERARAADIVFFVDARDVSDFERSHVTGALSLPGHTIEQLQKLTSHPTVLALARSPASLVVVYSDNGSKLSRCVHVCALLRQLLRNPERVRRLSGGLNGWKRAGCPVRGDARTMFAGQHLDAQSLT